jgi:hypothetical protein
MNIDLTSVITISALVSAVVSIIVGLVSDILKQFFSNLIDNYFHNRNKKEEEVIGLADKIIKLCTRGTKIKAPFDYEEIIYMIFQVTPVDSELAKLLIKLGTVRLQIDEIVNSKPKFAWREGGELVPAPVNQESVETHENKIKEEYTATLAELILHAHKMKKAPVKIRNHPTSQY